LISSATSTDSRAGDPVQDVHALFAASLFGFQMALREWHDNEEAARELREIVNVMARFELERGDVEHAARLLSAHPDAADAALRDSVQQRLELLRSGRDDLDALIKMREDLDINRNQRQRQTLFLTLALASVVVTVVILSISPEDALMSWRELFMALGGMTAVFAGIVWWLRDTLLKTDIDRRIILALSFFMLVILVQRLTAWSGGLSISRSFFNDLGLSAVCTAMLGVLVDRRVLWASLPFFMGLVAALFVPGRTAGIFGISGMCAILTIIFVSRRAASSSSEPT
jgi:hypothetical protein